MKLNQKATHEEVDPLSLDEPSQTPTKTPAKTPKYKLFETVVTVLFIEINL